MQTLILLVLLAAPFAILAAIIMALTLIIGPETKSK